jgi:hypothetical protein
LTEKLEVFLSYSYNDRFTASKIKQELENAGLSVFMAHDDIEPSLEWKTVILKNLKTCDLFIPLFSSNFKKSNWTDQETGIAFGFEKIIIPLTLDEVSPYGFVGKYQGLKCRENISESCKKILEIIMKKPIADKVKDVLIDAFLESESFDESNKRAKILLTLQTYNSDQIHKIVSKFMSQSQINGSWRGREFVSKLVKENPIDSTLKSLYNLFVEKQYDMFAFIHDEHLYDRYIEKILSIKPNLTREVILELIKEENSKGNSTFTSIYIVTKNLGLM